MQHYKQMISSCEKMHNKALLRNAKYLRRVALEFSNRLDKLEQWITENTDTDGTKLFRKNPRETKA